MRYMHPYHFDLTTMLTIDGILYIIIIIIIIILNENAIIVGRLNLILIRIVIRTRYESISIYIYTPSNIMDI